MHETSRDPFTRPPTSPTRTRLTEPVLSRVLPGATGCHDEDRLPPAVSHRDPGGTHDPT